MLNTAQKIERITVSLPVELTRTIEALKKELHVSKSEILKIALERFLREHRKQKLHEIAEMMAGEYETDKKLTEFTVLDKEDFR